MITTHWANHILLDNINNDDYVNQLREHIMCTIPFHNERGVVPEAVLIQEFHKDEKEFDKFKNYVHENINSYIKQVYEIDKLDYFVKSFIVTHGIYSKTSLHNHRGAFLSGVFYVNVDEFTGELIMHDPRFNANRSTPMQISKSFEPTSMLPKNGDIVIFPSFVYHETNVSFSHNPRILIPFDVYIKD